MPDLNHRNLAAQTAKGGAALVPQLVTTAQLTSAADPINTRGKRQGKLVLNTTTNLMLYAFSSAPTGAWYTLAGVSTHTPA